MKHADLFDEGDRGEAFYVVGQGAVHISKGGRLVAEATAGQCFGELALLYSCPRAAAARCPSTATATSTATSTSTSTTADEAAAGAEAPATSLWMVGRRLFKQLLRGSSASREAELGRFLKVGLLTTQD
jgi:hypothetical protein